VVAPRQGAQLGIGAEDDAHRPHAPTGPQLLETRRVKLEIGTYGVEFPDEVVEGG
jgi:hypothetical protein